MLDKAHLRNVPLPEDLSNDDIFSALRETQEVFEKIRQDAGIDLSSTIQANNFSGLVSNIFTQKLGSVSIYRPYHDQRYPDLMHQSKEIGLEVKASNKPMKGGEGHNGHSGWHIVVCFTVLEGGGIDFTQVEIANLTGYECADSDWHYLGSKRNSHNSQRTETYVTTNIGTAKLRDGTVYLHPEYVQITGAMVRNRVKLASLLPIPEYSPFKEKC